MFGIQCESCQKYITGKVLEVTLQLTPTADTVTLAVPAVSPSLTPGDPGSSRPGSPGQLVPVVPVIR